MPIAAATREDLLRLAAIERGSASHGEARAAKLLAEMFRARGLEPTLEHETAASGFWPSTGLAAATGALAGLIGGRARIAGAALAAAAEAHEAEFAAWCTPGVTHVDDRLEFGS